MYRNIVKELITWKDSLFRKPLILSGARQVGKTYILKQFGKTYYKNVAYINCDNNTIVKDLFIENYDTERIILTISAITKEVILPKKNLIILDEIQELQRGLSSLKYFCENAPEYHICVAGSLLGIAMRHGESFPVGKVDLIKMYPMSFDEFLRAKGNDKMADILLLKDWNILQGFHSTLIQLLREYYFVGGMPSAVATFISAQPAIPLKIYEDFAAIKLYLLDVGLLGALTNTPSAMLLLPNNMEEGKGMFTENYVCTQLAASIDQSLFYYSRETSSLEIDFIIQQDIQVVPIEVKAKENLQSQSLKTILQNKEAMRAVRFSMSAYREQERITNVPLYGAGLFFARN